jgi:ribosomal protein L11 methylase PrmA
MRRLVARLRSSPHSQWSRYGELGSFTPDDASQKRGFVARVLAHRRPKRLVDLGCNIGTFSELALADAGHVIGVDGDAPSIDRCYQRMRQNARLSLVVSDLANPSPGLGWANIERTPLIPRLQAEFALMLAVLHHLRIAAGIPITSILDFLLQLAPEGIVEWVDREDPMVRSMLALRADVFDDYSWLIFEAALAQRAMILRIEATHGGTRRLCHYRRR